MKLCALALPGTFSENPSAHTRDGVRTPVKTEAISLAVGFGRKSSFKNSGADFAAKAITIVTKGDPYHRFVFQHVCTGRQ